jgi:hypothetical protein
VIQGTKLPRRAARLLAAGAVVVGVLAPTAAFAVNYPNGGTTPPSPADPGTKVEAATTTSGSSSLPFTGGDVLGLTAIGGGAVVIGGVLAQRGRRGRSRA